MTSSNRAPADKGNAGAEPCCPHATMYHGARGCDECGCMRDRQMLDAHSGSVGGDDIPRGEVNR